MSISQAKFTEAELSEYKILFKSFDHNNDGFIEPHELQKVLENLKMFKDMEQVKSLIKEVDKNNNGKVEFDEFLDIVLNIRAGKETNFTKVYAKQKDLVQMKTATGVHSFSEEEMAAFAEHLNMCLENDADVKYLLPVNPKGLDLCQKVHDGVLLAKFINIVVKETIDERALNKRKKDQPIQLFQANENQNLVLSAAKAIGVKVTNIGANEMMDGEKNPHLVLGLVWQLVKIHLLSQINLKHHPELIRLLEPGEDLADLLKLPPEQLLLRWFNYHLKNANHKKINNFGGDVKDSDAYTTLLHQISPNTCDTSALQHNDLPKRAEQVLGNAGKLGVKSMIKPRDICSANPRLNLVFTAAIFNQCPGLDPPTEEEVKKAGLLEDDFGDSREERAFRMWINSLGIDDLYVNSLYEDCKAGIVLLKVIDHIEPGIVSWPKVEKNPNNKFKKLANDNYAVLLGKQLKFSLVGIGGSDVCDGNKKLLLAFVWQLMRHHTLKFVSAVQKKKFGGGPVTDQMIIDWANKQVENAGRSSRMKSYQDPTLATGLFFLDLLHSINEKMVDWSIVKAGVDKEEQLSNAKYVISVARKMGATIFLLPEDIAEVKPKMILTLVASCMAISK